MAGKRRIRVIGRHSTEEIADRHRQHLERQQVLARTAESELVSPHDAAPVGMRIDNATMAVRAARSELKAAGISPTDDLTTRHERFRRLKWAVGVFA